MPSRHLVVRELPPQEIARFLSAHHVGRLAYGFHNRVDIVPVHYVYDDQWLYGRTSLGPKLETLSHSHWVAFEVDDVHSPLDWTSVVVHGTFRPIDAFGSSEDQATATHAMTLLRKAFPEAFTEADPAPHRTVLFRIHVDDVTGRRGSASAG